MKYPCNLIQDLLPLYHDGVCSRESAEIIEEHLTECSACQKYHTSLCETDEIAIAPPDTGWELKKAASFQALRKKLLRKQVLADVVSFVLFVVIILAVVGILKGTDGVIDYESNISVSMVDNSLIGRLKGKRANSFQVKRVEIMSEGQTDICLFFCLSGTRWDEFMTSDDIFSEYVLCPFDKGAGEVDAVYYYTGDYIGIETLSGEELQKVIHSSVLLWSK